MAWDVGEPHSYTTTSQLVETHHLLNVEYCVAVNVPPAIVLPLIDPFGHAVEDVHAVGPDLEAVDIHPLSLLYRLTGSLEFGDVVRVLVSKYWLAQVDLLEVYSPEHSDTSLCSVVAVVDAGPVRVHNVASHVLLEEMVIAFPEVHTWSRSETGLFTY